MDLSTDYRRFLLDEISRRRVKNPAYSANAFARDIGISKSFLSMLMSQKRSLDDRMAIKIARKLGWNLTRSKVFRTLVQLERLTDPELRAELLGELERINVRPVSPKELDQATFNYVSKWYYFAILEMTALVQCQGTAEWFATRLKIPILEVALALKDLVEIGLLSFDGVKFKKQIADYASQRDIPSKHIQKFHQQILSRAEISLMNDDVNARDFSCAIFAMKKSDLAFAKQEIHEFRRSLMSRLENISDRDQVCCLAIQIFPIG